MPQSVTAVDIGASSLHALRLEARAGQLELTAAGAAERQAIPSAPAPAPAPAPQLEPPAEAVVMLEKAPGPAGPAAASENPDAIQVEGPPPPESPANGRADGSAESTADADRERERELRAALASLLRKAGLRSGRSVIGLGGSAALIRYLQVPPVPPWKLEMMMKYEVQEQLPSGEPSAFDYRILDLPDVGGQLTVMLAQVQERRLLARLETATRAGLSRPDVDLNCLGLLGAYLHGHGVEDERTVLLADIGAETVTLVVVRGSALCFARSVPGGGARFTAAAAEALGLSPEQAEVLKRSKGRILPPEGADDPGASGAQRKLSAALEREAASLAGLIDASLMYCRAQTKQARLRPDEVLLSGGGAMLAGLPEALARRLRLRVGVLAPFRKISLGALPAERVEELSAEGPRYAVALGLAAARLASGTVRFSLVTEAAKARRQFLEGGVYMWYAAAALLAVAGVLTWAQLDKRNVLREEAARRAHLLEAAKTKNSEFESKFADVRQRHDEVEALEERVYSGEDIVKVLGLLRKRTWGPEANPEFKNIVVLEAGNDPPQSLVAASEEYRAQAGESFQKKRRVFIRCMATLPITSTPTEAERRLKELKDRYKEELLKRRSDGADNIVQEIVVPQSTPVALELSGRQAGLQFVMEMILTPPQSRLAAAGAARPGGGR